MDIPEHIDVDVTNMEVGDVLRLADMPSIGNVTLLDDPHETVIATVSVPRGFAELEEAEAAEGEAAGGRGRGGRGGRAGRGGVGSDSDESSDSEE